MCGRAKDAKVPKKRPSSAKLSRDLRGGSDRMSRAVADNFILSAVDLPDLPPSLPPLPPVDTRNVHAFRHRAASSHPRHIPLDLVAPPPISLRRLGHISVQAHPRSVELLVIDYISSVRATGSTGELSSLIQRLFSFSLLTRCFSWEINHPLYPLEILRN